MMNWGKYPHAVRLGAGSRDGDSYFRVGEGGCDQLYVASFCILFFNSQNSVLLEEVIFPPF